MQGVAFSLDGERLTSVGLDGMVRVWPAVAKDEMLCDKLTSNMSREQWREWVQDPRIEYRPSLCPGLPPARDGKPSARPSYCHPDVVAVDLPQAGVAHARQTAEQADVESPCPAVQTKVTGRCLVL